VSTNLVAAPPMPPTNAFPIRTKRSFAVPAAVATNNPALAFYFTSTNPPARTIVRMRSTTNLPAKYPAQWPVWTNWPISDCLYLGTNRWRTPAFLPTGPKRFFVMTHYDPLVDYETPPNR
jgi:hypothetical protein